MNTLFEMQDNLSADDSNEWYTPARYIEAARQVMGTIDLDPASCELANRTVKAQRYYTSEQDGLRQQWSGNVWLNPPYSASIAIPMPQLTWSRKLLTCYQQGQVEQGILLIMACVKQRWFHDLWSKVDTPICFTRKRIYFLRPAGSTNELRESTCFFYLGPHESTFIEVFSQFGTLARAIPTPKSQLTSLWEGYN
jgi:phage N-6-adenine-methyltransferase